MKDASRLLIDESPLVLLPSLAVAIGDRQALALQQVHYWLRLPRVGKFKDGRVWVRNSLKEWHTENFPFWSFATLRRIFDQLVEIGLLLKRSDLNTISDDTTLWYSIDYDKLDTLIPKRPLAPRTDDGDTGGDDPLPPPPKKEAKPKKDSPWLRADLKTAIATICYGENRVNEVWKNSMFRNQMSAALSSIYTLTPDVTKEDIEGFPISATWLKSKLRAEGSALSAGLVASMWNSYIAARKPKSTTGKTWNERKGQWE